MITPRWLPSRLLFAVLVLSGCADPSTSVSRSASERAVVTTDAAGAQVLLRQSSARSLAAQPGGLFRLELPHEELASASHALHDELGRCAGFMLDQPALGPGRGSARALQVPYTIDNGATVSALLTPLQESNLRQTIQGLADFPTRFHDSAEGYAASLWIRNRWQMHASGRPDVSVQLIEHEYTPQPSISLTIVGSKWPEQLVVLGGHMDSINPSGGAAPGADDNASGIAVLDEVIRSAMLLGYRPERTVVFYAYAAEEIGLVGSAEIAADAAERELDIAGVLQLDMTNYNPAASSYVAVITDYTDEALSAYARTLIETYGKLPWQNTECGYACSDHASWQSNGFPVHHVHEARVGEGNNELHTARDTLALSDGSAEHSLHFAQYSAAFMAELAKGTVPECDGARPCPAGEQCNAGSCEPLPGAAGSSMGGSAGNAGSAGSDAGTGLGGNAGSAPGGGASSGVPLAGGAGGSAGGGGAPVGAQAGSASSPLAPSPAGSDGCSCRTPARGSATSVLATLLLLAFAAGRRKYRATS